MKSILKISPINLVRAVAVLCAVCLMFMFGCNLTETACQITVSGAGSLCNINYSDSAGGEHSAIIQSDGDIITIDDCEEVLSVDCS